MTYKVSRTATFGVAKENLRKIYQKKAYYFQEQLEKKKKTQSKIQFDDLNSFGFTLNKAYQKLFFFFYKTKQFRQKFQKNQTIATLF